MAYPKQKEHADIVGELDKRLVIVETQFMFFTKQLDSIELQLTELIKIVSEYKGGVIAKNKTFVLWFSLIAALVPLIFHAVLFKFFGVQL